MMRCAMVLAALSIGCGASAPAAAAPSCPEAVAPVDGSRLPWSLEECHYLPVLDEGELSILGVPSQSAGPFAVWVETDLGLTVGVSAAGVPNLGTLALVRPALRLRVEEVLGPAGEPLLDPTGPFNDPFFEDVTIHDDPILAVPIQATNVRMRAPLVPGAPRDLVGARRQLSLLPLADAVGIARVRGELGLRLPVGVETAELAVNGAAAIIAGATVSAARDGDEIVVRVLDGADRFVGVEPVGPRGEDAMERCGAPTGDATLAVSCVWERPFDTVRVGIARSILERSYPFDLALAGP